VGKDALAYWSDDGRSFVVSLNYSRAERKAVSYVIDLAPGSGVPELPAKGISDATQLAALPHVHTIPQRVIEPGRTPHTYAYVKETVQRNLYRIPLR